MCYDARMDTTAANPPSSMTVPQQALWWLKKGDFKMGAEWEKAHTLCQRDEGERSHDLVHALSHWIEGDISNRDYWYRRVASWKRAESIEAEWNALAKELNVG